MAVKDFYGNNLRRGCTVSDRREDANQEGEVIGTVTSVRGGVLVRWEGGAEEVVGGGSLILKDRTTRSLR